jgi:diadenosine tetraphosphatase ApaH/serine/threonine PP2A family protein phosphatase
VRVGIISDLHSNLAALDAVLAHMGSVDAVWCLGDVVGYGPDPNECIARLRERGVRCIAGNHDWAAVGRVGTEEFNRDAAAAIQWTARQLTPEARAWLAALEPLHVEDDVTLAHGSPYDPIWEYVLSEPVAARAFRYFATALCLVGHTHIPCSFVEETPGRVVGTYRGEGAVLALEGRRALANPGSVGQPRDGDPRAAYLLFDRAAGRLTWRRTSYPVAVTQAKMARAGLPPRLASRLAFGR